jgi:hypothetical protein
VATLDAFRIMILRRCRISTQYYVREHKIASFRCVIHLFNDKGGNEGILILNQGTAAGMVVGGMSTRHNRREERRAKR